MYNGEKEFINLKRYIVIFLFGNMRFKEIVTTTCLDNAITLILFKYPDAVVLEAIPVEEE